MEDRGQGWVVFATVALFIAGVMRIFDAIWAFSYHGTLPQGLEGSLFSSNIRNWGWIFLIVGIILMLCSGAVLVGSQLGRWIGVLAGAIACISAIWWMPYYPVWSLTYIVLGVLVVYALAAYGGRETTA